RRSPPIRHGSTGRGRFPRMPPARTSTRSAWTAGKPWVSCSRARLGRRSFSSGLGKPMDLKLTGKAAIVTGASRGIGRAIAQTLAAEGMKLTLAARSKDQLDELAKSLKTDCLVQAVDLRTPAAAAAVVEQTMKKFGAIDVLVNNAGATKRGDFFELTDADWEDGFALKFFGAMRLSRAAWAPLMASRGCIVNIVGIGGRTGNADLTIGGSVYAALRLLTKALADRGVKDGVRINAINPGFIKTERLET